MAAVISNRIKETLPLTICEAQIGGVPGRKIFNSLCLYRDLIERINEKNETIRRLNEDNLYVLKEEKKTAAAFIAVDLQKAYDYVNRKILWKILSTFGYPDAFVNMIKTLYSRCDILVENQGALCRPVKGIKSIRQGCPLSLQLFVLYIEPLLLALNSRLKGIKITERAIKSKAFVDDITLICKNDQDIVEVARTLEQFSKFTGSQVNKSKTKIMGVGDWEGRQNWPVDWLVSSPELKLLGIKFTPSIETTERKTWNDIRNKDIGILSKIGDRKLTIFERNSLIKSLVMAKAIYAAKIIPCPEKLADKLNRDMLRFIWRGRIERPPPGVNILDKNKGGLGFLQPKSLFQALVSKTSIKILTGPDSEEKPHLQYWTLTRTKGLIGQRQDNNISRAATTIPQHVQSIISLANKAIENKLIGKDGKLNHKDLYNKIIENEKSEGKLRKIQQKGRKSERKITTKMWKSIHQLPPKHAEVIFLYNHDLLPTNERMKRLNQRKTAHCSICKICKETLKHLTIQCSRRKDTTRWILKSLRKQGYKGKLDEALRGMVKKKENSSLWQLHSGRSGKPENEVQYRKLTK